MAIPRFFCVHVSDPQRTRALLPTLPKNNLELASYLFRFLSYLSKFSAVTKMEASNLAIVFGPNVLRTTDASGLSEFPAVLAVYSFRSYFPSSPFYRL